MKISLYENLAPYKRFYSMHPLGFAYYPDGAHDDKDELEPGIVPPGSSSTCDADMTCPAPMYFLGDEYLGSYTNIATIERSSTNYDAENFGLDDYEPKFFHPLTEWIGYGVFNVYLTFDADTDYDKDMFYFCHVSIVLYKSSFLLVSST
jgi:hypothetical protein